MGSSLVKDDLDLLWSAGLQLLLQITATVLVLAEIIDLTNNALELNIGETSTV